MFWGCFLPSLYQAALISLSLLLPSLFLRLCAQLRSIKRGTLDLLASGLGLGVLWWYYQRSAGYLVVLSLVVYVVLLTGPRRKGSLVGGLCVVFIVSW